MTIRAKDLPFTEFYSKKNRISKKVENVVFPNPIQLGVGNLATGTIEIPDSLDFRVDGTNLYTMSSTGFGPFNSTNAPNLGSSLAPWGIIHGTSGSFSEQVNGKIKQYFAFHCISASTSRFYIPWYSAAESSLITDPDVGLTVVRPGRVLNVAIRSNNSVGSTTVGLYLDENTTAIVEDTSTLSANDRDVFNFGDAGSFTSGQEIHIGIRATNAGDDWNGMVEIEFDTDGSVGI